MWSRRPAAAAASATVLAAVLLVACGSGGPAASGAAGAVSGGASVSGTGAGDTGTTTPDTTTPDTTTPDTTTPDTTTPGTGGGATGAAELWTTYDANAHRRGRATSTPAYSGHLSRAWTARLDGAVYTQPLVTGAGVIVATERDTVYDLSPSTGKVEWRRHLATPVAGGRLPCGDINPSGVTGTPVADVASGRLFVTTFTAAGGFHHTLWALDLRTGAPEWSRRIDVPGSDPRAQQQRSALAVLDGRVYVAFGGLDGDCSDYKGRIAAIAETGRGTLYSFTTPNQREAAIWSPAGPVAFGGDLYVATGNGTPRSAVDDSDSVLRLSPELDQLGRFTPADFVTLSTDDLDLGSTSPALLPGGDLFMAGKQGVGYLLRPAALGGTGGQLAEVDLGDGAFGGAAVDGDVVYLSGFHDLMAVRVRPARRRMRVVWRAAVRAGPPIVAGGVVWTVGRGGGLYGFRLYDGRRVAYESTAAPVTTFPSLSASGSRLFVPEGSQVAAYRGA